LCPGDVESIDSTTIRAHIHQMMSSSHGEFFGSGDVPAITVRGLRVVRGKAEVIHDLTVTITRGTITGLLGPSGCGKTTLMRSVVGTQIVAGGSIDVLGHPAGSPALRHRVGYVTQNPTVYDDLRVIDNIRYFAALYGTPAAQSTEALTTVGLTEHRDDYCGNLSGGQRSRVSLACALVGEPDLLVLDEPTVGLDPVLRVDLWDRFNTLAGRGTTLLVSSHVMDEADHCRDLLLMRDGHLLAHTTPQRLREDTRCNSLEEAFLSVIRRSTAAQDIEAG
jgi:ABC-2 type transport system ATP-binding protein